MSTHAGGIAGRPSFLDRLLTLWLFAATIFGVTLGFAPRMARSIV